ncbi:MAG TPA: hypothetical protein EYP25_12425 [Anaerolineae bacterium]|nr:hypothetical protein [Caldilineae bacterium]HID35344.1 hypothetical protein [Anaerolineae bacterium]HIQ12608.1 hypothetical protein [Caldilineales bacterium]
MRVYANNETIVKKGKLGRRLSVAGLLILGLGMLVSYAPVMIQKWIDAGNPLAQNPFILWLYKGGWFYFSIGALIGGFIMGQIGNSYMRRFLRPNRPDMTVAKALKGFDDRNRLYVWASPIDLAFVGPAGVYAIVGRDLAGAIEFVDGKVKTPFSLRKLLLFFGDESGGRPLDEAEMDAEKLEKWLKEQLGADAQIVVKPLVVFTNDKVNLKVSDPDAPVIPYKQLKSYLRSQLKSKPITKPTLQRVVEVMDAYAEGAGAVPITGKEA